MRCLCIYKEDPRIAANIPPQIAWEMVEATNGWLNEMKRSGKVSEFAFLVAGHGGFVIYDAKTHAELHELAENLPARPLCTIESYFALESAEFVPIFNRMKAQMAPLVEKMQKMIQPPR